MMIKLGLVQVCETNTVLQVFPQNMTADPNFRTPTSLCFYVKQTDFGP